MACAAFPRCGKLAYNGDLSLSNPALPAWNRGALFQSGWRVGDLASGATRSACNHCRHCSRHYDDRRSTRCLCDPIANPSPPLPKFRATPLAHDLRIRPVFTLEHRHHPAPRYGSDLPTAEAAWESDRPPAHEAPSQAKPSHGR